MDEAPPRRNGHRPTAALGDVGGRERRAVAAILDGSGLAADGVLMVHSAFAGLSRAGYRAELFIEALMERVSAGTLLMPVLTWRALPDDRPGFDELQTPSTTGVLTEIFRTRYATARSVHPTHSAAAWGVLADAMTRDHKDSVTPCPPFSPFGRLADVDAHILLLGVDFTNCTAIHCWEEEIAPDVYLLPEEAADLYRCRDRFGVVHRVRIRRHRRRLPRDYPMFGRRLAAQGKLHAGEVDGTVWRVCRARDLETVVRTALLADPEATLAHPGGASHGDPAMPGTPAHG